MNLLQTLVASGIDLDRWSRDRGTKDLRDLQSEIDRGETQLKSIDGVLRRLVRVVRIAIEVRFGDKSFQLVEDKQIFFTGAVRHRELKNIAEKIEPDETPLQAVYRALQAEIGLDYQGDPIFVDAKIEQQDSPSYPGLSSCYQMFDYQIVLFAADLAQLRFAEVVGEKITLFTLKAAPNNSIDLSW